MKNGIIGAALCLVASQLTWAQGAPPSFDSIDTDSNGSLSQEEVTAMMANFGGGMGGAPDPSRIFSAWDSNGDGSVSREEFDDRPRRGGGGMGG